MKLGASQESTVEGGYQAMASEHLTVDANACIIVSCKVFFVIPVYFQSVLVYIQQIV
jgi:hypothetical protein